MDFPARYAEALGVTLDDNQIAVILDLARDVAHGSERRFAPLSAYVAGRFVAERVAAGRSVSDALTDATTAADRLLKG